MVTPTRPQTITVERALGVMVITWLDGHRSEYPLAWLRAYCPCATCREERRAAALAANSLRLTATPPPSTEVVAAEFVGHYAIRLTWSDGHIAGIFPFVALRASCPCERCNPEGAPPLIAD